MKIAQFQTHVFPEKERNLKEMEKCLKEAVSQGADLAAFGEMFCCPYETGNFPIYAEPAGGALWSAFSQMAAKYHIWLSAGSIPEIDAKGNVYNTAFVFDREGIQRAAHRKMHLFDIDVHGGQSFQESKTLTAGDEVTVFDTEFGKIGLCICFDMRFPELARLMVLEGAKVILVPAAFNMTTGPAHWEILLRCRAVDNQCFVFGTSPARDEEASYTAWGHSIAVSPWGDILQTLDEKAGSIYSDIDTDRALRIREELPLLPARRNDIYEIVRKNM